MRKWTAEQERAITRKGCNLLVSAAAGSGKTAVLVERIMRRILDRADPVDIDRLLVVTFTNAAAQEMKERIGLVLSERSRTDPLDRNLTRQFLLLGKSSISTLHSFCLELIRQNYYRLVLPADLALDPHFRIADESETGLIIIEVLEEVFDEKYARGEPGFLRLVECFGGDKDDKNLQDLVLKLYELSRSQPDPADWLRRSCRIFTVDRPDDPVLRLLFANLIDSIILPLEEALAKIIEAKEMALSPGGPAVYLDNLEQEEAVLRDALEHESIAPPEESWQALLARLARIGFASLKPCRAKEVDEEKKSRAQRLRTEAKELVRDVQGQFLSRPPQELMEDMRAMAPLMESLCALVTDFAQYYLKSKFARNVLDFSDIEHFALNLLGEKGEGGFKPSQLAEKLRAYYEEVLVDEYQDINSVQETVLNLVTRQDGGSAPNMFMVGDVKQSIYGFRLAEPGLFLEKYRSYEKAGSGQVANGEKVFLSRNFRSRKFIVDGVNFLFRQVMSAKLDGLSYDSEAELVCGAEYPPLQDERDDPGLAQFVEVHLIDRDGMEEKSTARPDENGADAGTGTDEDWAAAPEDEDLDAAQLEARVIGQRILEMTAGGSVWDQGKEDYRRVQYRDIVILLRTVKGTALTYLEELNLMGIPAYAETGAGYLGAQEVQVMLSLLRIIDNPRQDIPLAAVLRSAVVGLTAQELAAIRLHRAGGDFYDAVRLAARKEKDQLGRVLRDFLHKLTRWRTLARRNSPVGLIWLLFRETGYYDYVGAMPGGTQRQANLRALHDRAKQFENTTMKGLFKFLRFLEKLEESGGDLGTARVLGEKEDVVRIMSIHKSKGLEFPVVFLAGLGKKFNHTDLNGDVLVDKELGLGPSWVDYEKRLKYPTLARTAVKNRLKRRLLAEEVRILYVALTRAREALVLVGAVRGISPKLARWSGVSCNKAWELPTGMIVNASSFWDWLGPCLLRHREGQTLPATVRLRRDDHILSDPAEFKIFIRNAQEIKAAPKEIRDNGDSHLLPEKIRNLEPLADNTGQRELVAARLGWRYPWKRLAAIPAKLSVTEIKNRYHYLAIDQDSSQTFSHWREFGSRPKFLQEGGALSAGEKGSAFHLVMGHLDLSIPLTGEEISRQIADLTAREIITPQQAESVSVSGVARFFQTTLGERMLKSPEVHREMPFTLAVPVREIFGDRGMAGYSEKVIVQGTIDCLFAENDGYVLLDYKTDLVTDGTIRLLKERYRVQLDLYGRAVEAIFEKPVREKVIYSFHLGEAVIL